MWHYTEKYKIQGVDFYSLYYVQLVRLIYHYGLSNLKNRSAKASTESFVKAKLKY